MTMNVAGGKGHDPLNTITVTGHTGSVTGTTVTIVPTVTYLSKSYRQCGGSAWSGGGNCSSCGAYMGTGGVCLGMVEIVAVPEKLHPDCPCCECE
jgi:hypothetical protein